MIRTSTPANPLHGLLGYQLRRASAAAMDELSRTLATIGLRPTEASVLLLVGANPQATPSELGRELGVQRANMTPLVAGLERRGLLARAPVDGRSHGLSLTAEGETVRQSAMALMRAHDAQLIARLAAGDAGRLADSLARLWAADAGELARIDEPA